MILGHTIALDPTRDQEACLRRACGTARYAKGLAEWQRAHKAGEKPSMPVIKRRWNAHRKAELPWTYEVTKCKGDYCFAEIRRQLEYKAGMRSGRIMVADRFFPATQICSSCGCLAGPKGREELDVAHWICSDCGAAHGRDSNAAINLRKLGLAEARINARGHGTPTARANALASAGGEPRTETVPTHAHS